MANIIPIERVEGKIYLIRGQKVMIDKDLAELYRVKTKELNKAVKRNIDRFPDDFMFQLNEKEIINLRFQIGTSSWGGRRYYPYAFTEQGVAMLSSVLSSKRAIRVNVQIMRAFVKIKQSLYAHKELALKLDLLEERVGKRLDKHEQEIAIVFEAIRKMLVIENKPKRKIGFVAGE